MRAVRTYTAFGDRMCSPEQCPLLQIGGLPSWSSTFEVLHAQTIKLVLASPGESLTWIFEFEGTPM